jgi:hypothetical protein
MATLSKMLVEISFSNYPTERDNTGRDGLFIKEVRIVNNSQQGWISVKERLPESRDIDCFVIYPNGYGYGDYSPENKHWHLDFDAVGHDKEITHWMPRPELPKDND